MSYELQNDKNKIIKIKQAIIKAIAFFDMFDYPLTLNEIWQFIFLKCELVEVFDVLEIGLPNIGAKNGFYFLSGKEKNITERLRRYNFADRKFKRAEMLIGIFKFIPWIKMIGVANLLGARNLKDNSDIDLFIITENKRIWLTRFFCIGIIKLLGLRPQADNRRDKICLSFFTSASTLNLEKFRLDQNDLYFIYWLAGIEPIYDKEGIYEKFIQANIWLKNYLTNWQKQICLNKQIVRSKMFQFYYNAIDLFIGFLEQRFKTLQLKLLPQKVKSMMNRDSRVVVNDQIIKLHINDRREEYNKNYELRITNYFVAYEIFK
ncbi:MAG: hypothetical protein AAB653_03925 [Patescibacteria group bacterium]